MRRSQLPKFVMKHASRRCLRFMRLERRLMLSGDFGDSFETDDDLEPDDDFEDRYEFSSYEDDEDEHEYESDDHDDDGFVANIDAFFSNFGTPNNDLIDDDQAAESTSEGEQETPPVESSIPANDLEATLQESETETTLSANGLQTVAIDSLLENDSTESIRTSVYARSPVQTNSFFDYATETLRQDASDQAIEKNETETAPTDQRLSDIPETLGFATPLQAQGKTDSPLMVATHFPATENPSDEESLNSSAIAWLGSFADDISAIDEALHEFMRESRDATEASINTLLQPGPLVVMGMATTGAVARAVIHRNRARVSELENDFYAARFDVRLYPELFG